MAIKKGIQTAPTSSFNFENGGVLTKKSSPYLYKDFDLMDIGSKNLKAIMSSKDMFRRADKKHASYASESMKKYVGGGGPVDFYFKLFFYFDQIDGGMDGARLLGTDVDLITLRDEVYGDKSLWAKIPNAFSAIHEGKKTQESNELSNSALNFLLLNCEYERAEKLLKFIELLSYISTYEPWQFQQISGVEEALNRKYFTEGDFKIEEQRKAITIKCLPSGYNQLVGTLIDLYRDVCYSFVHKKEIVPANLRKFNMGLYIFSTPITSKDYISKNGKLTWKKYDIPETNYEDTNYRNGEGSNTLYCNAKYVEFRNCEIDYNSNVKTYSELNDAEGLEMQNEIKIYFDDASELRYDENILRVIGDRCFQDYDFDCRPEFWQTDDMRTKTEMMADVDMTSVASEMSALNGSLSSALNLQQYATNPLAASVVGYAQTGIDAAQSYVQGGVSNLMNYKVGGVSLNNVLGRSQNMNWNNDPVGHIISSIKGGKEDESKKNLGKIPTGSAHRPDTAMSMTNMNGNSKIKMFEDKVSLGNISGYSISKKIESTVENLGKLYSEEEKYVEKKIENKNMNSNKSHGFTKIS